MKKILLFPVLAMILCGNLWADFSLSAGAGGLLGGFFTRYHASGSSGSEKMTQVVNQLNYGGLVFFDATYGEFAVIIQGGVNNYDEKMRLDDYGVLIPMTGDGWETVLGFSLLGKYPFTLTEKFKLFPLLGIEYHVSLSQRRRPSGGLIYDRDNSYQETDKNGKLYNISAWNSTWINVGAGTDFSITKNLFLRGELLYGFRLMTPYEKDSLDQLKGILHDNNPSLGGLTSGPSIRLSVGYRFWSL